MNAIQTATENRFAVLFADPHSRDARQLVANLTDLLMQVDMDDQQSVDNMNRQEAVEIAFDALDKDVRLSARQQARVDLAGWIREYFDGMTDAQWQDGQGHEAKVGRRFGIRYWNRLAEIAGV